MNEDRKNPGILLSALVIFCVLIFQSASTGAGGREAAPSSPHYNYTDRLIVKYRNPSLLRQAAAGNGRADTAVNDQVNKLSAAAGLELKHFRFMSADAHVLQLPQRMTLAEAATVASNLKNDPGVEYAEPDRRLFPLLTPNDPQYINQWHYKSPTTDGEPGGANLPGAWDISTGSAGIMVAVIDSGILFNHADITGRTVAGYDFVSNVAMANDGDGWDSDPSDPGDWVTSAERDDPSSVFYGCTVENSSWHGTHVAGTIGAATNNGLGVAGINWTSRILPVRVMGKCGGYTSDIADGINWAVGVYVPGVPSNNNPARVLNLSFGNAGSCSPTIQSAINHALAAGAVVVVSAGNDNTNLSTTPFNPASCSGVITVAATTRTGGRASYSNYGTIVKIAAPGGNTPPSSSGILSAVNSGITTPIASPAGDTYKYYQGTSMAAPHVAGIASLILSVNPNFTPAQVLSRIQSTARAFPTVTGACTTSTCGAGIIDAAAAVNNPVPVVNSLSPVSSTAEGPAFTLTVNGNDFISSSEVRWNNSSRTTTYVSSTQITAVIPATDIAAAGTVAVTVFNPAPGGGTSTAVNYAINYPVPVMGSLSPASSTAGGAAFSLTVNGSNFINPSEVRWNNLPRTTTYISSLQLTAAIPSTDIVTAGSAAVTVVNPAPGGGTSLASAFVINNPMPVISSLNPSSATTGGAAFSLTVNGSNFVGTSQIQWNGNNRTTSFISSTQLTAQIAAADIASAGTLPVTVVNPSPGGGASTAVSFTINTTPAPSGGGGGGGCFIATAAFGSPLERHVLMLRTFRDDYLMQCAAGKTFIDFYYKASPPIAQLISRDEYLRALTRWILMPVVGIAYLIITLGLIPTLFGFIFMISILMITLRNARKKPNREA